MTAVSRGLHNGAEAQQACANVRRVFAGQPRMGCDWIRWPGRGHVDRGAPADVSTAGSALNWRHDAWEAGRNRALAPDEHASLAHRVAGSARDHILTV